MIQLKLQSGWPLIMMINCPKCNLLQPKDRYCAQCGINIDTWQPPQQPLWKKIAGNLMFQLSVLFLVAFILVLKDNFSTPESFKAPIENSVAFRQGFNEKPQMNQQENAPSQSLRPEQVDPMAQPTNQQAPPQQDRQDDQFDLQKRATTVVALYSRSLLDRVIQKAQKLDDTAYIIQNSQLDEIVQQAANEKQPIGKKNKTFNLNQKTNFFIGEHDLETDIRFGFFIELTVKNPRSESIIPFEVTSWHQLKLTNEPSARISYEGKLSPRKSLVLAIPSVHEENLTNDERSLFESSAGLRQLNDDNFVDDLSDVVLVIAIK